MLDPFDLATKMLSGEKYPTWSLTLPVLREIKNNLMNFAEVGGVRHADWYESAKDTVMVFRDELLKEFIHRFRGMDVSLLWTIMLDPRLTAMNGFNIDERKRAKAILFNEMKKVPFESIRKQDQQHIALDDDDDVDVSNLDNYIMGSIFSRNDANENEESGDFDYSYEDELDKYLAHCKQAKVRDPLQWWRLNQESYPVLAWLSRKWLCAVSTSVSSERLFSRTGATVTSRRARLKDDHVEMLTFVHDNLQYV